MDQELQMLINTLYGNKLNEKQLSNIIQMWNSNQNGYQDNMRKQAFAKMPAGTNKINPVAAQKVMNQTVGTTPKLGQSSFTFDKSQGRAANDMSAIADFKQAFRQARQGGHKTFFWKKTKANPSGMFSTETKPQGYDGSVKVDNSRVFQDIDKTDMPVFTGQPAEQFDVTSPRIPIQGKTDLGIFKKQNPVEVNITGNNTRVAGRRYGEGQKNANLYFGRKGAGMFSGGGNISQPGNPGASIADVITVINSKDKNAIQELFSSIGQEGFEQAIRSIQQMAKEGDGSAMQALQTLQELMQGSQKAKLGAKLNYIQKLKGICPEGEELVYMKEGGRVCPVCQKKAEKAQGGKKLEEKKKNAVSDFKEKRKAVNPNDTVNTKFGPRDLNGKTKYPKYDANKENYDFNTRMRVQEKDEKSGKKVIGSACGSKMKKKK